MKIAKPGTRTEKALKIKQIPDGTYPTKITKAMSRQSAEGDRQELELVFTVTSGAYKGRELMQRYDVEDSDISRAEYAWKNFILICNSLNCFPKFDLKEMKGKKMEVCVEN